MQYGLPRRLLSLLGAAELTESGTETGPAARGLAALVVDRVNHRVILQGGAAWRIGQSFSDLWQIPFGSRGWLPLSARGRPPAARCGCAVVSDPARNRLVLFGGYLGRQFFADTWVLELESGREQWRRVGLRSKGPSARAGAFAVHAPERNALILFGGADDRDQPLADVWELGLDDFRWQELRPSGDRPRARHYGACAFDQAGRRMLVFGGVTTPTFSSELWALDLVPGNEAWTRLETRGSVPEARGGMATGYNPDAGRMYVFGGWNYPPFRYFNDVHELDVATLTWRRLGPAGATPLARRNAAGVFVPSGSGLVVFGGDIWPSVYFSDTHLLSLSAGPDGEWASLPISPR